MARALVCAAIDALGAEAPAASRLRQMCRALDMASVARPERLDDSGGPGPEYAFATSRSSDRERPEGKRGTARAEAPPAASQLADLRRWRERRRRRPIGRCIVAVMFVNRLSAGTIEAARGARTALLRVVSPAEAAWRIVRGRPAGPPLWLRRHAGPVRAFESAAADCRAQLLAWGALAREGRIVDLGCGPGAMALALAGDLGSGARYDGIDVHAPSIAWCRRRFAGDARFRFERADVVSAYGRGGVPLSDYRLPIESGSADLVLAKSLFTHLAEPEAERYLSEIARILAPAGRALVTAFLFGENPVPAFPFGGARFRWRVKSRPSAATAFARPVWEGMLGAAGLRIEREARGFYPGDSGAISGQDVQLLFLDAR